MMTSWRRSAVPVLAAFLMAAASDAAEKNHTLTIEDKDYAAAPGDDLTVRLKSGGEAAIKIGQNELSVYKTDQFSFSHPAAVSVEVRKIEGVLSTYFAFTASGTSMIVQHHEQVDDESLVAVRDIFVNNVLRNPIASGARIARSDIRRKLHDGTEIKGVRAMVANEKADVTVAAYTMRLGKGALMFVTIFNKTAAPDEGVIIDQFWDTLRVKG